MHQDQDIKKYRKDPRRNPEPTVGQPLQRLQPPPRTTHMFAALQTNYLQSALISHGLNLYTVCVYDSCMHPDSHGFLPMGPVTWELDSGAQSRQVSISCRLFLREKKKPHRLCLQFFPG